LSADLAIPILRFRAGTLPCAVAARDVRAVRGAATDRAPLWQLLGMPAAPDDDGVRSAWTLGLAHDAASAEIIVQGPVEIAEIRARDLLRRPDALVLSNENLVVGFVRCARELVLLLDIPTLVKFAS
jgi:hypothetical protein